MAVPISNVVRRIVFAPSGVGPYAFTFEILAATDIEVYKGDTLLTLTTDYTVTINTNGTGSVTLVATAGTDNITIVGARTIQRTTDFVTGGDLFANSLNEELDSLTIFTQQNAEAGDRSIRAPVTDPTNIDMTLPTRTDRAGKYLSFNSSTGDPEVVNNVVDITAVANNATNINTVSGQISPVNNISTVAGAAANIATVAGIAANVTTVAGISGNVTTVAGISADVTTVAADGTDIGTVAGLSTEIAALGPIAADITAVAAVDSDVTAVAAIDSDVTAVAGVAANVTTVAGIAANVTTVAGISADVTTVATNVTDITNFSDVYLGPAATDPATRNDSSALQAGDLYFNTALDVVKVYDGAAWQAAFVPTNGFLQAANNLSDVASTTTARTNLGVGTGDSPQFTAVNIGHATDTTVTRVSAGIIAVEGSNVLMASNLGVSVQGYDADTAKTDVAQTFTVSQRGTVTTDNDGSFDLNATNNFLCTPTGGVTLTFTNITAGQSGNIVLVNGSNHTISAAAATKVSATALATISATGTYWLSYYSPDGTNVYVANTGALA